jgi:hypothetical protein
MVYDIAMHKERLDIIMDMKLPLSMFVHLRDPIVRQRIARQV